MYTNPIPSMLSAFALAVVPAVASADTQTGLAPLSAAAQTVRPVRRTCSQPDVSARLTTAAPIEIPTIERQVGGPYGPVSFEITLAPDGMLVRATVLQSSGRRRLDESGLEAIRASRFAPEQRGCNNVGGTYRIDADLND